MNLVPESDYVPAIRLLGVHQGGEMGGAPVSLVTLFAGLEQTAFTPRLAFTEPGGAVSLARARQLAVDVVPTGGALYYSAHATLSLRTLTRFLRTYALSVQRAQRYLRTSRPDILHLNTSVLFAWAAAARREHVPVLWYVREVLGPQPTLRSWQAGYILRHASTVVATSNAVRRSFPRGAPVRVVPNALDLAEFRLSLLAERGQVRQELGIAERDAAVMMLGSVQRPKGHWLLLDAFARVLERCPDALLVLVCGGAREENARSRRGRVKRVLGLPLDNLEALLEDADRRGLRNRIRVTGFRTDVPRVLAAADLVVFPSLLPEGFGRPLIEALAMQRPVVATNVGPTREILGATGTLTAANSAALARAMVSALTDRETSARLAALGRARVESLFSLPQQVSSLATLYGALGRHG